MHLANASVPFTNTESTVLSISSEYSDRRVSPSEAPAISSSTGSYLNRIRTTERSHYDSEDAPVKASHYKSRFSDDRLDLFKKTTVPSENVTLPTSTTTTTETEPVHVVQITDKPVYYTSYHLTSTELNPFGPSSNSKTESTTKKFRATVEMPEMNIPTEKELLSYHQEDSSSREEEDEEEEDDEDTRLEDLADYSYLETTNAASTSTTPSTTTTTFKAPTTTVGRTNAPYKPHYRSSKRYTTSTTTEPTSTMSTSSRYTTSSSTTERLNLTTTTQVVPSTSQLPTSFSPVDSYEEDEIDDETDDETDDEQSPGSQLSSIATATTSNTTPRLPTTTYSMIKLPPRASRVNNAIKTTIAAAQLPRRYSKPSAGKSIQCTENSLSAKCNEIPSRY